MRNETHLLAPTIHADPAAFIGAAGVDFRCRRFGGAARAPMRRLLLGFRKSVSGAGTTTTIPIVFVTAADPVEWGLVASLNRPGGNLTGITNLAGELVPKRLQLLRELLPNAARFGVLEDPPVSQSIIADQQAATRTLGLQLLL
jgi:hypothetical protein